MKRIGSVLMTLILLLCAVAVALPAPALAEETTVTLGAGALTAGNKVWFGSYSSSPVLWRVLQSGDGKALLISNDTLDKIMFNQHLSNGNAWSGSNAQSWCSSFYTNWPDGIEKDAILATSVEEENNQSAGSMQYYYQGGYQNGYRYGAAPLNNEHFFFLSAKEADTLFTNDDDRKASGADSWWWLRSSNTHFSERAGVVENVGWVKSHSFVSDLGARPAFNINLNSVLFSSLISSSSNQYKLTLYDSAMTIAEGTGGISRSGNTVKVPYTLGGDHAGTASRVALLITGKDDTWTVGTGWSSGAAMQYYETQTVTAGGSATFNLPDSLADKFCGTDYAAYLLAVDECGDQQSDYASAPVAVMLPDSTTYPLWIGGTRVTEKNRSKLSDNHWSYAPSTHTLTLSGYSYSGQGYNYSGSYYAGIYYNGADALTVSLSGENSVTQTKGWGDPGDCPIVIDSTAALTVAGSGSLTAQQGDKWNYGPAILSSGPVTLSGGTVKAVGAYYNGIKASTVTVKSTVTYVDIKGTGDNAKAVDGTLINEIDGIGYNRFNQPTKIAANTAGAALSYQHVVFPIAQYTLRFDANGGGGSMADKTVEEGESYTLPDCGFTPPTDKKFNYWDVHGIDLIGIPGTPAVIISNCADEDGIVAITAKWIDEDKAPTATVKTAPTALNPTYNGGNQALVSAGLAEGGAMRYALGSDSATAPTSGWSADVPTAANYGTYSVWYKAAGDNAHSDSAAACVTVTIQPKAVTVTAQSHAFAYTGNAQTWPYYDVDGLEGEDEITGVVSGSITFPSESPVTNKLESYQFTKGNANNYSVTTADGQLTMTNASAAINITAASQEWTYDGLAHANAEVTVTEGSLLTGDELIASASGSVTDVSDTGAGNNPVADGYKVMHGNADVTASYAITPVAGTLTVKPKAVNVIAKGQTINEGGSIDTGVGQAELNGALAGHALAGITLTADPAAGTITPSGARIEDGSGTDVTGNYAVTYTTGELTVRAAIRRTVTFRVVNGAWNDDTMADITVTLTGFEGDTLRLTADQIPAVGNRPLDPFKAGGWDVAPSTETAITADTTYTYTYAPKRGISATVTFKVVNGSWDDGNAADITVTLTGFEGDTLKLAAAQIPAVGNKPADTYKAGAWDVTPSTETAITAPTTYTYSYAPKDGISQTVTFKVVNGSWDDGTASDKTVTLTGHEGDTLKLTADQIPAVGNKPAANYQAGSWDVTPSTETIITGPTAYTYTYAAVTSYTTTSGDGQEYRINSNDDLEFIVKCSVNDELTFPNFRSATLDGQTLGTGDYDTAQGSLIFTLKAAKAKTLALGTHTLTFTFTDGTATATFTVKPVAGSFEDVAVPSDTFTFRKEWQGSSEKSIDFTLYKIDGSVYHHGFDKKVVSNREWRYNAWFSSPAACYVIEEPIPGYITKYVNVGVYAGITDRCCDGGTIINKKIPKTGDEAPLLLWACCAVIGVIGVTAGVVTYNKMRKNTKK